MDLDWLQVPLSAGASHQPHTALTWWKRSGEERQLLAPVTTLGSRPRSLPIAQPLQTSLTGSSGNTFKPLHRRTEGLQLGWAGEIKRERNFRRLEWKELKRRSTNVERLLSMYKALGLTLSTT